jgi:hypothetical protein|tara:strand:+ start:167 stop:436 length:270 start_codon:yes stop_codon:yes gene_type:complete
MSGNRFNRLPTSSIFMDAFNRAMSSAEAANNMQVANQIEGLKTAHNQLANDMNVLAAAVEREFLKMSHKISEDDTISVTDQLAWFMNGD